MELEIIKSPVKQADKIYEKKSEYPIDCEFTLPDYCPDIERILKCNIVARVSNLSVLSDTAQAEINAEIKILYISKDDKLFGYEMPVNLSKSINIGEISGDVIKSYRVKTEYTNCRAVNSRKIDVHGSVSLFLCLKVQIQKNCISNINDRNTVLKKEKKNLLEIGGFSSKQITVSDDIVLPSSEASVLNIINYDVKAIFEECKTLTDKAVVKIELCYEILYLSADMRYEVIRHTVPVSQVIDVIGADEKSVCRVKTDISSADIKVITDGNGEMRTVNTETKINISVIAYDLCDTEIVTDGYSVRYDSSVEKETLSVKQFVDSINQNVTVNDSIEVSSDIGNIIDFKCTPLSYSCKCDNGNINICGDIAVFAFIEDEKGGCKYYEKVVAFEEKLLKSPCGENSDYNFDLYAIDCSYSVSGKNSIDFKCELNVCGIIVNPIEISAVTNLLIDEEKEKNYDDMPSLTVYFAMKNENLWDIALKYNTSVDRIKETNDLSEEVIKENKMLLIPSL